MKFTKEETSLCKQIVERYEKPIEHGDWFIDMKIGDKPFLTLSRRVPIDNLIPLWTIKDCLEFLRGEGYLVRLVEYEHYGGVKTITCYCHGHKTKRAFSKQGNKDEEACLKAVLAVLEERK